MMKVHHREAAVTPRSRDTGLPKKVRSMPSVPHGDSKGLGNHAIVVSQQVKVR